MNLEQLLPALQTDEAFLQQVTHWQVIPAKPARTVPFPSSVAPVVQQALAKRAIPALYTHQAQAIETLARGENVCVVTPTASGKTLCYNLPVVSSILKNPDARALYLFPTKALAADQSAEIYELIKALDAPIKAFTYDGDTPVSARRSIRQAGHVVITNPDMLHAAILPGHTTWVKLFENLQYIVIDEIHTYRGLFGSNLANVIRRLKRLCSFYGSNPQFICCSATIANPKELCERLIEAPVTLIDDNGAPTGERHIVFYNPPVVNKPLGIRASSLTTTRDIASTLIQNRITTIVFARSRLQVEVLAKYLKDLVRDPFGDAPTVRAYRGGYLPTQRRAIEKGLRQGEITGVVATNALELGIDIGRLDACVLCGYPGTIASTWQQAGRAGRRQGVSLTVLVATSSALDQFIIEHPEYFFKQSPENALLSPDNLYILMSHLKCAAYELPFEDGEPFGRCESTAQMLDFLLEQGFLRHTGGRYHWSTEEFPSAEVHLRTASAEENFMIVDITQGDAHEIIGEMDRYTVPMLLHEQAIYLHEAQQYQVEKLDFERKKAFVRQVDVGYYTDADLRVSLRVLRDEEHKDESLPVAKGEVLVTSMVKLFKKLKYNTHENLGSGRVELPEVEMTTTACWWTLPDSVAQDIPEDALQGGMMGIAQLLREVVPVYCMCASRDVAVSYHVRDPFTQRATVYLYDNCPGGMGLSDKIYDLLPLLLSSALSTVQHCGCEAGCPSCVGPRAEVGALGKATAIDLLQKMLL